MKLFSEPGFYIGFAAAGVLMAIVAIVADAIKSCT